MKGRVVGDNSDALLWPNRATMSSIFALLHTDDEVHESSSSSSNTDSHTSNPSQLLWPTELISELAQRRSQHNFAFPLAIVTFIFSALLGIIIGPVQLILLAATTDYTWVTNIYYSSALKCTLIISSFVAIIGLVSLILAWRAQQTKARLTCILVAGSLTEILAIWFFGGIRSWQPHQLTLSLASIVLIFILLALILNKQYSHNSAQLSPSIQITLVVLSVLSVICATIGPVYLSQTSSQNNSAEIAQLAAEQAQARIDNIPAQLSDLTFTLCSGKYQVIYFDEASNSGIFECSDTHEVYTVTDPQLPNVNSVHGLAMYLGNTQIPSVSRAFPTSYYIYHHLSQALPEIELALVTSAYSETDLVDNISQQVLNYWQSQSDTDLFLNIFYASSLHELETTSDYILLAALGTISMSDQLPHGNTLLGYYNGNIIDYIFQPDTELNALNAFGSTPSLYPVAIREALRIHPHISVHLKAGDEFNLETMHELLQNSFVEAN